MASPSSQRASERPVSFVLHDVAAGAAPFRFDMSLRPEDLTRTEPSRLSVHHVLGGDGAYVESAGPGVASLQISGHTGWRGNATYDGLDLMLRLRTTVFQGWHEGRARALVRGVDPDKVRLIFVDGLDDFSWLVAPQSFTLRRNKARPLLAQYSISLLRLGDYAPDTVDDVVSAQSTSSAGLTSLDSTIKQIRAFSGQVRASVEAFLAPIKDRLASLVDKTAGVLEVVRAAAATGQAVISPVIAVARDLAQVATNVSAVLSAVAGIPSLWKSWLTAAASEFRNALCLLQNVFDVQRQYPDYSPLYGASNCSSTSGGRPVSRFVRDGQSGLEELFPAGGQTSDVQVSRGASVALRSLAQMDPVFGAPSVDAMDQQLRVALAGTS